MPLLPLQRSFGNSQHLVDDLGDYFIEEGGVTFGSPVFANEDGDRTISDLKLEGGRGRSVPSPPPPPPRSSSLTDGVSSYFGSLEVTAVASAGRHSGVII